MTKIPVTKTVVRNGQTHTQTYWEEDDKKTPTPSRLAGIGVSLPPQQKPQIFPTDLGLENQWRVIMGDQLNSPHAQAAIAAGLTFGAAQYLSQSLPENTSLSDYIYENGWDQNPRPKGGWENKDGTRSADQKWAWENAGVPLDEAVNWIDAGFKHPTSNVLWTIRDGVPLERAEEWAKGLDAYRRDAMLAQAASELRSDISYDDVRQWRAEFHGHDSYYLSGRELGFYEKGFTPSLAKRWNEACYEDVDIDLMIALKDLKWSPSILKDVQKISDPRAAKIGTETAVKLIADTPKLGSPKLVKGWASFSTTSGYRNNMFPDDVIDEIKEVEAFKERTRSEIGVVFRDESNRDIFELSAKQRETLLLLMDDNVRFLDNSKASVWKACELSRFISSPENMEVLHQHGFVFSNSETHKPYNLSLSTEKYNDFDATSADKQDRDFWMKDMSLRLYATRFRKQEVIDRLAKDDRIDPVKLREVLINDPEADDLRIEALLVANVAQPVAEGWL